MEREEEKRARETEIEQIQMERETAKREREEQKVMCTSQVKWMGRISIILRTLQCLINVIFIT